MARRRPSRRTPSIPGASAGSRRRRRLATPGGRSLRRPRGPSPDPPPGAALCSMPRRKPCDRSAIQSRPRGAHPRGPQCQTHGASTQVLRTHRNPFASVWAQPRGPQRWGTERRRRSCERAAIHSHGAPSGHGAGPRPRPTTQSGSCVAARTTGRRSRGPRGLTLADRRSARTVRHAPRPIEGRSGRGASVPRRVAHTRRSPVSSPPPARSAAAAPHVLRRQRIRFAAITPALASPARDNPWRTDARLAATTQSVRSSSSHWARGIAYQPLCPDRRDPSVHRSGDRERDIQC